MEKGVRSLSLPKNFDTTQNTQNVQSKQHFPCTFSPIYLPSNSVYIIYSLYYGTDFLLLCYIFLGGQMSRTLKELNRIPILSNYRCNQAFTEEASSFRRDFPRGITSGFICAGFLEEEGRDSCGVRQSNICLTIFIIDYKIQKYVYCLWNEIIQYLLIHILIDCKTYKYVYVVR